MNRYGFAAAVFLAPAVIFGCAKQPATMATATPAPTGIAQVTPVTGNPASAEPATPSLTRQATHGPGRATDERGRSAPSGARPAPSEFIIVRDLVDVHFDFDKYEIRPRDAEILDANARWLRANENVLVLIAGHCDERGTEEYNLSLGDRRAKATMSYLVAQGIAPERMVTISYGKERPQCTDHNEACWARNRRAHFLVKRS